VRDLFDLFAEPPSRSELLQQATAEHAAATLAHKGSASMPYLTASNEAHAFATQVGGSLALHHHTLTAA
jgi:hypothetical protein